ncbi:MAG: laccase domain-containing protein [Planctomycetota bacterium]|nr:MAG: laccase domain-containing protein [Planctomycetota bacterium]
MIFETVNGRRYARFESLAQVAGLRHAFSTRPHDVALRIDRHMATRAARRAAMVADWGLDPERLLACEQSHETRIAVIDEPRPAAILPNTDATIVTTPIQPVMNFSADCPLILIDDSRRRVIATAHASWRCTVAGLTAMLIERMRREFGCDPAECVAGIGPSAGPLRYEVGADVYAAAANLPQRDALFPRRGGKVFFDLWAANRAQLEAAGVPAANIETAGICTISDADRFYSYRREGAGCGHFGLLAALV